MIILSQSSQLALSVNGKDYAIDSMWPTGLLSPLEIAVKTVHPFALTWKRIEYIYDLYKQFIFPIIGHCN